MIVEGKKLTAFDAMEAAMELSGLYLLHRTHEIANFRYSTDLKAVVFDFCYWEDREGYIPKASFTVFLDNETEGGDSFSDVFEFINEEKDRFGGVLKGKVNSDYMGKEDVKA